MRRKILLAEDSVTIQKVFEIAFAKSDVALVSVDNGDDAVRAAEEASFDLVIADVTLPGKDGYEVASAILGRESAKELPVLILSGTHVPLDEGRLKASGAKGVLFKPFEAMEMLEKVETLLRKAEGAPAAAAASEPSPKADERWDFSDVLDEVEEPGTAPAQLPPAAAGKEERLQELLMDSGKEEASGYDEFDVSIDDIEAPPQLPVVEPPSAPVEEEEFVELAELEEIEDIEEIQEEIQDEIQEEIQEEIREEIREEIPTQFPLETSVETPEEIQEALLEEVPEVREKGLVPEAPAAIIDEALQERMKEQFAARAEAVFREVAAEAMEKAMWEMMDRLAGEFSARIRESVEAVAWEVIPATAEALIREEISRIRSQAGKPTSP